MSKLVGQYDMPDTFAQQTQNPLISKGFAEIDGYSTASPTIVCKETHLTPAEKRRKDRLAGENARDRRTAERHQHKRDEDKRRAALSDSAALAYYLGLPLNMRITMTWAACLAGERTDGHIIGLAPKTRDERCRGALYRALHRHEKPFAAIWARDRGGHFGDHMHLGLHWPRPRAELIRLLVRLTGCQPKTGQLTRDVIAEGEWGGWQIKVNGSLDEIGSASRWADYLLGQGPRHLVAPNMQGMTIGTSRLIDAKAVEAMRGPLEAWKAQSGWMRGKTA